MIFTLPSIKFDGLTMTDALKAYLQRHGKPSKSFYYSQEQEMLDSLVLGQNMRQWKAENNIQGNVRDRFTVVQINDLKQLQATNAALITLDDLHPKSWTN